MNFIVISSGRPISSSMGDLETRTEIYGCLENLEAKWVVLSRLYDVIRRAAGKKDGRTPSQATEGTSRKRGATEESLDHPARQMNAVFAEQPIPLLNEKAIRQSIATIQIHIAEKVIDAIIPLCAVRPTIPRINQEGDSF